MKRWKYSISTADAAPATAPILLKGPICQNLIQAASLGYNAVEIHTRPEAQLDYDVIGDTMNKTNVRISTVITGRLNTEGGCSLIDDRPYVEEAAMKGMCQYIDMAHYLGTDIVLGWIKGKVPPGGTRSTYLNRLSRNLSRLSEYAGERDVRIYAEVINRYETNIFTTARETMEFIEETGIQNLYAHLDTFHMGIEETDPIAAIRRCKGKLGYFHLADNTRSYPGSGQFDFLGILKALEETGYDGYLSVECLPGSNNEATARQALLYMKDVEGHV